MLKRCVQKTLERIVISLCVILSMQLPFFITQYTHQLKGHLDELKWQVQQMERSALLSGKNLDQYISKFINHSDRDFANQGSMMRRVSDRFEKLSHAWMQLNNSSLFNRPFMFIRYMQLDVFYATIDHFKMGISFTLESIIYGLIGILLGSGFYSVVALCFHQKKRVDSLALCSDE